MRYSAAVLLCALTVVLVNAHDTNQIWHTWKSIHGKEYAHERDENGRRQKWERNVARVKAHNLRHDLGLETYTLGLNQFADMDWDEFREKYLTNFIIPQDMSSQLNVRPFKSSGKPLPEEVDWRVRDRVTPARSQGKCGSCWAFSAVGALEGAAKLATGKLYYLSDQQLVDCSRPYGTKGCSGGWPINAYKYVRDHGIMTQADYPYVGREQPCAERTNASIVKTVSWVVGTKSDEHSLQELVAFEGPTSACITVTSDFYMYWGGIFNPRSCEGPVNHAVLVTGYSSVFGEDYWGVKNSWGPQWGELGFMRMARNGKNLCKIADFTSVPTVVPWAKY